MSDPEVEQTNSPQRRIFLVDDHPLVREGLANLINQQGDLMVCGQAEDAAQALAGIGSTQPELALIDISLKTASGLELVKDLKQHFPPLMMIVLSMHDEMLYAERALRAGARGYVMKRETTKEVLTAIRRVLQGDIYVSERVSDRELEIFRLLGQGLTTSQIATDLHLSLKTVQAYCARAKEKFGVDSLSELLRAAIRWEDATHVK